MKIGRNRQRSLRWRLSIFVIVSLGLTVALCWVAGKTLLEDYFIYSEKRTITRLYQEISQTMEQEGKIDSTYLESLSNQKNVNIMVVAKKNDGFGNNKVELVYSSAVKGGYAYRGMFDLLQNLNSSELLQSEMNEIYRNVREKGFVVLNHTEPKLDLTSIDLLGSLGENYLIIVDSSAERLQASAAIAVRFLAMASILVSAVASVFVFFYSRRFTRPIEEMSEIAGRMANLDFEAKVTKLPDDEIGKLGESMNSMSEQLERTITELKNANVELLRDNEKKAQIDEMRKEFLSHVSHELKTPIALIQGYAEGLAEQINEDAESRAFYCEVIVDEAQKMNQMVQQLLSLNELESGQNQLDIERFDLSQVLDSVIAANKKRFSEKNVTLQTNYPEKLYVWGDALRIEDVVNNYINNAYNYSPSGGNVEVYIDNHKANVLLWVYNKGDRIPDEELDQIWIKFYKVDKARTREYGGSGVGLSIVAAIMQAHHMDYGVENRKDGVAFYIELEKA